MISESELDYAPQLEPELLSVRLIERPIESLVDRPYSRESLQAVGNGAAQEDSHWHRQETQIITVESRHFERAFIIGFLNNQALTGYETAVRMSILSESCDCVILFGPLGPGETKDTMVLRELASTIVTVNSAQALQRILVLGGVSIVRKFGLDLREIERFCTEVSELVGTTGTVGIWLNIPDKWNEELIQEIDAYLKSHIQASLIVALAKCRRDEDSTAALVTGLETERYLSRLNAAAPQLYQMDSEDGELNQELPIELYQIEQS